jgi:predicted signal transduction protein with EAL and GGDEF domain
MERVRTNLALGSMSGATTAVTVSFGVAEALEGDSFEAVVERADAALRVAKETGRNRVVAFGAEVDAASSTDGAPAATDAGTGPGSELAASER